MRFISLFILILILSGCVSKSDYDDLVKDRDRIQEKLTNCEQSTKEQKAQNTNLIDEVNKVRVKERELEINNFYKERAAADYMMCSWPINFCPESIQKAGKSAISAGFGGGSSTGMWYRRLSWYGLAIVMLLVSIFSFMKIYNFLISPKNLEIEKHKALIADSKNISTTMIAKAENEAFSIILAAKEQAKNVVDWLEQKNKELDQVGEEIDSEHSDLANLKQDVIDTNHALAKLKADLARMEMLKNAMRSGPSP